MQVVNKQVKIGEIHNKTHIPISFHIDSTYNNLIILFSYSPQLSVDHIAKKQLMELFEKEQLDVDSVEDYLPVENFLSLTLFKEEHFIGTYHNKSHRQKIFINNENASHGFNKTVVDAGQYELIINCHSVASEEIIINLIVEVN